jgi:tetratricopeptide (TPR) repeat protein
MPFTDPQVTDYRKRGAFHAALGQFSRARSDLESAIAAGNSAGHVGYYERYLCALCYLHDGDQAAYRAAAGEIVTRFTASQDAKELHWTIWTCILAPGGLDDYRPLVELARCGYDLQPTDLSMKQALGAVLFRAGEFEQALGPLNAFEAMSTNPNNTPLYARHFLAMTHFKLGHDAEARQWFDRAEAESKRMLADGKTESGEPLPWNRRLTLELLWKEARALLGEPGQAPAPQESDSVKRSP